MRSPIDSRPVLGENWAKPLHRVRSLALNQRGETPSCHCSRFLLCYPIYFKVTLEQMGNLLSLL